MIKFIDDAENPNFINFGRKKKEIILLIFLLCGSGAMLYLNQNIIYTVTTIIILIALILKIAELKKLKDERRRELRRLRKIEEHKFIL